LLITTVSSELIFHEVCDLQSLKAAVGDRNWGKTKTKHCKIACQFELDFGLSTAGSSGLDIGV